MKAKKAGKVIEKGRVYISSTFNNTIVTITDDVGNTLGWGTSGSVGFKGTRKSTPFAAMSAADQIVRKVITNHGMRSVEVYIKGPGSGRDAALRTLKSAGLAISLIADLTPMPHNGVRPKKKRRV